MSNYQPRSQGGWPAQPPQSRDDQGGYGQAPYATTPYAQAPSGQRGPQGPAPRPRPRRRRKRGWIALVVVVLLLVGVAAIGDQVARSYAESEIASQIETSSQLQSKPSVTIEGWPFLTQLASKDLQAIDISASNVKSGKFEITSIKARATGVHLSSLSKNATATIDHITGSALISFQSLSADISSAIGIQGLATVSADPQDGPNAITVNATVFSVVATVTRTGPAQITISFGKLGGFASLLGGAASIPPQVINIPKLPAGLAITSITVTSQGIVATAVGNHTTLSQ